jgi:DNA-binding transcriptional ArsR family regulator
MAEQDTFEVTSEATLQALAHPLRLRLLGLLRADGPATATGLAARVGESSGSTSYHLRQLAKAGFIEEAAELGNRRERWWRAAHRQTSWSPARFLDSPSARRADVAMRTEMLRWQQVVLEQWLAEEATWDADWVDAAGAGDFLLELTPDELRSFAEEYQALVARYAEPPRDGARRERVIAIFHTVPIRELPL